MTEDRLADGGVAEMPQPAALPRKSGELVFHDEWERRIFAMAVSLSEQGYFDWSDFQQQLIRSVGEAEKENPLEPSRGYFESWLLALERLMSEKGLPQVES